MPGTFARGLAATALAIVPAALAQVPVEKIGVADLPPAGPHRVYVTDIAISHLADGKLHVVDGDSMKYLGLIATANAGQTTLSPDRRHLYVATTYHARLWRGERTDVVDIWDTATLSHVGEIVIPPRRAQALNYRGTIRATADGRFLLVQNATPAASISIVDLEARKFVAEVQNPGCWTAVPSASKPRRFATLCGDGSLLVFTLGDDGNVVDQQRAEGFFDPDSDPLFVQVESVGDVHRFVSFQGRIHTVDLSGESPRFEPPWSLLAPADRAQRWRPGGYQLLAIHRDSNRLFVTMHPKAREGSHKDPAHEIWVFDLETKKRVARVPASNAISIVATQDSAPLLFAIDAVTMGLVVYDIAAKPRVVRRMAPLAETAFYLEAH